MRSTEERAGEAWERHGNTVCLLVLAGIVFAVVGVSGNLTAGPRVVDENQIYLLDGQISEQGVWATAREHVTHRVVEMNRLVPVYLLHKIGAVWAFGTNLAAWHVYTAFVGALAAGLLYVFSRMVGLTALESLAFAFIAVVGEQSVLWWRLLHGEGIGLVFTGLALVCVVGACRGSGRNGALRLGAFAFAVLAALSKESFILLMPAIAFGCVWQYRRERRVSWAASVGANAVLIGGLGVACIAAIAIIRFGLGTTYFHYTGWAGFDADQFRNAVAELFAFRRSWIAIVAGVIGLIGCLANRDASRRGFSGAIALVILSGLVVLPQVLLYMSSGFEGERAADLSRFLIPATLGLAALTVFPVHWARRAAAASDGSRGRFVALGSAVVFASALAVYTADRTVSTTAEATAYAAESREINAFFDAVARYTAPEDSVLVAFSDSYPQDHVRLLSLMLTERLGLRNVAYLPIAGSNPRGGFQFHWIGQEDAISERVEGSTIASSAIVKPYDTIIVPDSGHVYVELPFVLQEHDWFRPEDYFRYKTARGDVAYFRIREVPFYLKDYRDLLSTIGIRSAFVTVDGRVTVRGWVRSPELVERVALLVDDEEMHAHVVLTRRDEPYRYFSHYSREVVRFKLTSRLPAAQMNGQVSVVAYGEDDLLAATTIGSLVQTAPAGGGPRVGADIR